MKKIILTFLIAIISFSTLAQTPSQHLTFKGVPIDGTLTQFVNNMKEMGFTATNNTDRKAVLIGDFAGYQDCNVYVSTLVNKDLVCAISVLFPACSNWSTLEENYSKLKQMLTTKFGAPAEVVEKFQNPESANDDYSKRHELIMDRCNYRTLWKTDKGNLLLKLVAVNYYYCHVRLEYYDKINGLAVEATAMDDL